MCKPPLLATVFTLVMIALLCGLGIWQVKRLHWKEGLLAQLDQAYSEKNPPMTGYEDIVRLAQSKNDFAAAQMKGTFTGGKEILLGIRTWHGEPGYHALAALQMPGGAVLVNRGWVPGNGKNPIPHAPQGSVTVKGILHRPDRANFFVPPNNPAAGAWYRWDLAVMAQASGIKNLAPLVLYEQSENSGGENGGDINSPVREALRWELPNNHLGYALFWFSMAGVLAVIYWLRFVRK